MDIPKEKQAQCEMLNKLLDGTPVTQTAKALDVDYQKLLRALNPKKKNVLTVPLVQRLTELFPCPDDLRKAVVEVTTELEKKRGVTLMKGPVEEVGRVHFRCYSCGDVQPFSKDLKPKFCKNSHCSFSREWSADQHDRRVTHLLEWAEDINVERLPSLTKCYDLLAHLAPFDRKVSLPYSPPDSNDNCYAKSLMPYGKDWLAEQGLACGSPLIYHSDRVRTWLQGAPRSVFVLDFSWCRWSRTLKDPRSWAILNTAVETKKRILALWTAGNAGLSLAMLASAANRFLPFEKRFRVYACHEDLDQHITSTLSRWGARPLKLLATPSKQPITPQQIFDYVKHVDEAEWEDSHYWDVTDAWDAVGTMAYRVIFAQVISQLQPTHVVVPVGTGNLVMGILKAASDCKDHPVKVYAATALNDNVFREINNEQAFPLKPRPTESKIMSKISGTYSAMCPCIEFATKIADPDLRLAHLEVDLDKLRNALHMLSEPGRDLPIFSEPSSAAAFGVLHELCGIEDTSDMRLLVVNTGSGILSEAESAFMMT